MSDVQSTSASQSSTTADSTPTQAPSPVYYEFTEVSIPQLATYTGRSFTTDAPNTTPVAPPAVTGPTLIQYWINGAWFIGKKESYIGAAQVKQYIADVVFMRSQNRNSKKQYPTAEIATFAAQYQGALDVKAGKTSDVISQLASIRGIGEADMATIVIAKNDAAIADQVAFAQATHGLQALAGEVTSLDQALATGLVELYPLLQWCNNPLAISHKILSEQSAVGETNG